MKILFYFIMWHFGSQINVPNYTKSKQALTRQKGVRKRVKHRKRCKIVKSVTPSGVTDFTILHLSRCYDPIYPNRTLNKTESCLNQNLNKTEFCLNQNLNKTELCINLTLNKVPMQEIFINLTCINCQTPVYFKLKCWSPGGSVQTGFSF